MSPASESLPPCYYFRVPSSCDAPLSISPASDANFSADNFADQYVDQKISISDYSLSASVACGKFCCAMVSAFSPEQKFELTVQEEIWDIV